MTVFARPHRDDPEKEYVSRVLARRRLIHFVTYTMPGYEPEPVHEMIAATLEKVLAGEIDRVMLFCPPQVGKSQLASVHLPAFWLASRPDDPIILTSYASSLANAKSREARGIVESPAFRGSIKV